MKANKRNSGAKQSKVSARGALLSHWQQHLQVAQQSLEKLRRNPGSSFMTIAVIGIALLLPCTLFVALDNLDRLSGNMGGISQISVYLKEDVSESKAIEISKQLLTRGGIETSRYVSPEEGAREFAAHSGLGDVIAALDDNPLPGVIVLSPSSIDSALATILVKDLQAMPEVAAAQLDLQWIERLQRLLQLMQRASRGLMLILAFAVLFVVGNTIRLAIESRRAEIVVIKLVGGTNSYVARPFLYTGAFCGFAGGVFAWILLALIMLSLGGPADALLRLYGSDYRIQGLGLSASLLLLLGSAALGWLGAWISVRQHLAGIEPR